MSHDEFERAFWGDCCNTFDEEQKHFIYAKHMGLEVFREHYTYNLKANRILDIGSGPCSLLLKCKGFQRAFAVDPLAKQMPKWVHDRYDSKNIVFTEGTGEKLHLKMLFDEVWMYNVLQHTEDPQYVVFNALEALKPGGVFRAFEWINIPPYEGHPHMITRDTFESVFSPTLIYTTSLNEQGCVGEAVAIRHIKPS